MNQIPINIILSKSKKNITLEYADSKSVLDAEFLRINSPSAEVRGHSPDQKKTVSKKKNVSISSIELIGNYAIRISFNDGHDTGIFTWQYLDELYQGHDIIWREYISQLRKKGMTRD
jgi:DUF971 family protein|tara:strand:- start:706 stop:1056 length:351 start_codon:yes stop_codon:yes gene_type:complete